MEQYLYSIIRYAPLSETGEFANVGIVMAGPKNGYFGFELSIKKHKRITDFFDNLTPELYKAAVKNLQRELRRMEAATFSGHTQLSLIFPDANLPSLFMEDLLRKREGVIRFSDVRLIRAENPKVELERLHKYYVERTFVTQEYEEQVMEREVKKILKSWKISSDFVEKRLSDGVYSRNFPFVKFENGKARKVIKPISLRKTRPETIIEHANSWAYAISRLHSAAIVPNKVFLPVKAPEESTDKINRAFNEAKIMLEESGAILSDLNDHAALESYLN